MIDGASACLPLHDVPLSKNLGFECAFINLARPPACTHARTHARAPARAHAHAHTRMGSGDVYMRYILTHYSKLPSRVMFLQVLRDACMQVHASCTWMALLGMTRHGKAAHRTTPHHTAPHCPSSPRTAQRGRARHGTARHGTAPHHPSPHRTAQHHTAQHGTARHCTALHCTRSHRTAPHRTATQNSVVQAAPFNHLRGGSQWAWNDKGRHAYRHG